MNWQRYILSTGARFCPPCICFDIPSHMFFKELKLGTVTEQRNRKLGENTGDTKTYTECFESKCENR